MSEYGYVPLKKYEIDPKRCRGCQRCVAVCPANAIHPFLSLRLRIVEIDQDACIHCGKCVQTCPLGTIRETRI